MSDKKFAFESGEVSIAFTIVSGALGDTIIAKAVFDAVIKLVPTCKIDVFCPNEFSESCAKAFYGSSKNFNRVLGYQGFYAANAKKYDAALRAWHMVIVDVVNVERLQSAAPNLLRSLQGVIAYNKKFVYTTDITGIVLRNIARARISGIDRYTCLSCGGALPIHDNRVEISLSPESERAFRELKLRKNYITIGSNLQNTDRMTRHTLKEWSTSYATEYITLINRHLPQVQVVQCGGGGVSSLRTRTYICLTQTWNSLSTSWRTACSTSIAKAAWFILPRSSAQSAWCFSDRLTKNITPSSKI